MTDDPYAEWDEALTALKKELWAVAEKWLVPLVEWLARKLG